MLPSRRPAENAKWLRFLIKDYTARSEGNRMESDGAEPIFGEPLVGFASGADPLFQACKEHIGDFYLTPAEVFRKVFSSRALRLDELAVISWVLPAGPAVLAEQAEAEKHPSRAWVRMRHYGERLNEALRMFVMQNLMDAGVEAVAPVLEPFYASRHPGAPLNPCSNWSERHVAFAAGLGTFGLCDGLITERGKAMRAGSVVTRLPLYPTPRPYGEDLHAYCLHYTHGTCGKCIERCPVGAISPDGHDKELCMRYVTETLPPLMKSEHGIETDACGLCQAGVPCADHIPAPEEG